jgi:hypothetical protein
LKTIGRATLPEVVYKACKVCLNQIFVISATSSSIYLKNLAPS